VRAGIDVQELFGCDGAGKIRVQLVTRAPATRSRSDRCRRMQTHSRASQRPRSRCDNDA
jgi:hypothetical protein